jgi:hypothetical protein
VLLISVPGSAQESIQHPDWMGESTGWSQPAVTDSSLAQPDFVGRTSSQTFAADSDLQIPGSVAVDPATAQQDALDQVAWLAGGCSCDTAAACCDSCGCGDTCGCGNGCSCDCTPAGCIPLGDPCTLTNHMDCPIQVGGWMSMGYHSDNTRQSFAPGDLFAYNDVPDNLNLHQGWLFIKKDAQATSNTCDFGFRFDTVYGTDAQSLQATGSANASNNVNQGRWDASLDHGIYGWAMPQAYVEVALGDNKIKAGYFYSLIGYESSLATENFFYSHSLTMFNSEPFTHTGAIVENTSIDGLTLFGGWVAGWDSAWESNLGGSAFLGGFSVEMSDAAWFTYATNIGDFGFRGDNGYTHSLVLELQPCNRWDYVIQSDYHSTDNTFQSGFNVEEFGIVQYLYYEMNRNLSIGGRCEWWNSDGPTGTSQSYYELTGGINIMPHANVTIRPEIRHDWTPGDANFAANNGGLDYNNTVFGCDCVITY